MKPKTARKGNPKLAVAYVRVSDEDQKLSPEAQRKDLEACAEKNGWRIVQWCADAITGKTELDERPGLAEALVAIKTHKAGVLLVLKRDRLARDAVVAGLIDREIARAGAVVYCADGMGNGDAPAEVFMRRILDAAAELERKMISLRTIRGLKVKQARGEMTGKPHYGTRLSADGKHLEPEKIEEAMMIEAVSLYDTGLYGVKSIAAILSQAGYRNRAGKPLAGETVRRMLGRAG